MLEFVNADVVRDYDKFVDIIVQYEQDAVEMNAISMIQEQTENNRAISNNLEKEVNRFEKV